MADENKNLDTTEVDEALTDESIAAIDKYWDDDSGDDWSEEKAEADGHEAEEEPEETDETETEAEPEETDEKPEDEPEAGHQRFKLKINGEEKEVDLDEMTTLAQKGGDYDGLKTDRDNLRTENGKLKEYESFLKELADNGGISIDDVIESTRVELLMRKAEKDGEELTEEEARKQVRAIHKKQPEAEKPHEKTAEEKAQEAVQAFVKRYPNVKSADIPQSVWDEANRTGDLIGAYQEYRLQAMSEEISKLKQNNKNKERSTGSRKTAGATTPKSKIDEAWEWAQQEDGW